MSDLLVRKPLSRVDAKCLQGKIHCPVLVATDIYCTHATLCHEERPRMHRSHFMDVPPFDLVLRQHVQHSLYLNTSAAVAPCIQHEHDLQNYEYE